MRPPLQILILTGYTAETLKQLASWPFLGFLLFVQMSSGANAMGLQDCDYRGMAQAVTVSQIQKAYELSVECEKAIFARGSANFGEVILRNQYLETAQILTMQGKLDAARARIVRAEGLPENFLISSIEDSTRAFLRERSLSTDEAIRFYQSETEPDARARLAILYLDRNQATAAADAAQASLKVDPTNPTALIVLGALLEKTDPTEALVIYNRAIASAAAGNPSQSLIRYLDLPRAAEAIARLQAKR
jgi:tetratricopeptide (TPR) repeat protein